MLSTDMKANLALIEHGEWNAVLESYVEQLSAKAVVDDMTAVYPIVFQERHIGRKHEIGMAAEITFELRFQKTPQSLFTGACLLPVLRRCVLISSYDDAVGEITLTRRIRVKPNGNKGNFLTLSFGSGVKVDKTIDGWCTAPLRSRGVPLSESVLKKRGWHFNVLLPFGLHASAHAP